MVDAGWRAPRPSLKVGQDYRYQQRSPIYLLVAKRAGIDTLMCAGMKLARELKGGCNAAAEFNPVARPSLNVFAGVNIVQILYYHL